MSRDFKGSRSSPSVVLVAAAVLLALLVVGSFVLLVLGGMFWYVWSGPAEPGPPAQTVYLAAAPDDEQPPLEESAEPDGGSTVAASDRPEPPDALETEQSAQALASLAPVEVMDVHVGGGPLVRPVETSGQSHVAIWAQPVGDAGVSQVSYSLDQRYTRLRGQAVVADADEPSDPAEVPTAVFRIYGDGNLLWDVDEVCGYGSSRAFELNVSNVDLLVLVVESGSPGRASPFAWAGVELLAEPSP